MLPPKAQIRPESLRQMDGDDEADSGEWQGTAHRRGLTLRFEDRGAAKFTQV